MRTKITALLLLTLFLTPLQAQKKVLFGGKELTNWYAYNAVSLKHERADEVFPVEKHLIRLRGKNPGYLMSNQSFTSFKLTAQYRWNPEKDIVKLSKTRNSGLMYLVPDTAKDMLWCTGIQYQIKEKSTGDFIFLGGVTAEIDGKETTAGKSMAYPKIQEAEKPVGKWNKLEITVRNGTIVQKLNGKIVNTAKNPSVTSGRVLLQYEGYPVDFKNIIVHEFK